MDNDMMVLLDYFVIAELAQTVLLVFIMLIMKRNRRANIFLTAFIIILAGSFIMNFFRKGVNPATEYAFMIISVPGIAIEGPLIYFYSGFITDTIERLRVKDLLHCIPFAVIMSAIILIFDPSAPHDGNSRPLSHVFIFGSPILISFIYFTIALIRLKRYERQARNYFSDYTHASVNWLKKIIGVALLFMGLWNVGFWRAILSPGHPVPEGFIINCALFLVMIFITAYYLVNQPEIFRDSVEMKQTLSDDGSQSGKTAKRKYARQNISDMMQSKYLNALDEYMLREKPYLNEELTIKDLSLMTGIPVHHLSIAINNKKKTNFYAFINEYRVAHAVRILDDPSNIDSNVLSIAFRSGFNSKSTFNDSFKRITGKTPSEYRTQI